MTLKSYSIEVKTGDAWREWGYVKAQSVPEAKREFYRSVSVHPGAFRLLDPNGRRIDFKAERKPRK